MISRYSLTSQLETLRLKNVQLKEKYDDLLTELIAEMDENQLKKLTGYYFNPTQKIESIDQDNLTFVVDGFETSIDDLNIKEIDNTIDFIKNHIINQ